MRIYKHNRRINKNNHTNSSLTKTNKIHKISYNLCINSNLNSCIMISNTYNNSNNSTNSRDYKSTSNSNRENRGNNNNSNSSRGNSIRRSWFNSISRGNIDSSWYNSSSRSNSRRDRNRGTVDRYRIGNGCIPSKGII